MAMLTSTTSVASTSVTPCTTEKSRCVDAVEDHQPHARQREHLLDDDGIADQESEIDAEHGDHRHESVAQGVADEHAVLGNPLGARRGDVVGFEHREQTRAQAAYQQRDGADGDRQRRQEHAHDVSAEAVPVAADGEDLPAAGGQQEDQHDAEPERRHPEPDDRNRAHDLVDHAVLASRCDGCQWHGDHDREQRAVDEQPERHGGALDDHRADGVAVQERVTEVAVRESLHEQPVLLGQRAVESPLGVQLRDQLRRGAVARAPRPPDRRGGDARAGTSPS